MQHPKHTRSVKQWLSHLSLDARDARRQLPKAARLRLEERIRASEARHLGELRVCVEASLSPALLWRGVTARSRAVELFGQLGVWDTEHNNGVLIYLLMAERRIEVLADRGLMRKLDQTDHWDKLVNQLAAHLGQKSMEVGLQTAIDQVGQLLQRHYPLVPGQAKPNELPDGIVLI